VWLSIDASLAAVVLQVTDMQGRAVVNQEALVINGLIEVNVEGWAAGNYVVNVAAGEQVWATQIVVQH
jgi:hypothetical protein